MRLASRSVVPPSEAESPSGRPDIGGSGSPAPTTTRAGAAGGGATDLAIVGSDAPAAVASLADLGRSGIAKSGLVESLGASGLADPPATPEAGFATPAAADGPGLADAFVGDADVGALGPPAALAAPTGGGLGRRASLVDASGGGCGGSPPAIRCRADGASGWFEPEAGAFEVCIACLLAAAGNAERAAEPGAPEGALGGSVLARPGVDVANDPRERAGSRPSPPGGAFPEFTAYVPTSTPTMAATTASNGLVSTPRPAKASTRILPLFD
jgi:hypothetical protein